MSRPNRNWRRRARNGPAKPWTPEEDEEVIGIARCGVASYYWHTFLPDRSFPEILERRDELRRAGLAGWPTPL